MQLKKLYRQTNTGANIPSISWTSNPVIDLTAFLILFVPLILLIIYFQLVIKRRVMFLLFQSNECIHILSVC